MRGAVRIILEIVLCGIVLYLLTILLLARNEPTNFIYFNF